MACYPVENFDQNAIFSRRKSFTSLMGMRTCSMLSRSRMVTQWSAAMPFASSPTVSKSKVKMCIRDRGFTSTEHFELPLG